MNNYSRNSFKQKENPDERLNTSSYCLFAKDDDQKIDDIKRENDQFKPKTSIIKKDKNNNGNSYRLFPHINSSRNENNERKDLYNKDNNIISMNNNHEKYNNKLNDNNEFNIEDEENLHSNININNFHVKNNNINNFNKNIFLNDRNIDDKNKIINNNNQNNYFFNYNNNNNNYNNININQNKRNDFKINNNNKIINKDIDKKDKKLSQSCLMVNIDNNNYNNNNLNIKNNNNNNAFNNKIRFNNKNTTNIFKNLKQKDIYKKNSELENIDKLNSGALIVNKDIINNIRNMNSKTIPVKKTNKNDILKKNQLSKEEKIKREKEEKERSNIREKLKCYLCLGKIYQARMCLNCKIMACEKCVKNMIEKYGKCSNCKKEATLENIIPMPFLDDLTSYFINNVENQENQNNDLNINNIGNYQNINKEDEDMKDEFYSESNKDNNYMMSDIIMNNENNNISFCDEHTDKRSEYYCLQCRKYLCSKCLLFFNQKSVEKHKDHLILSIMQLKHFNLIDALGEYNKLCKSRDDLEPIIKETSYRITKLGLKQNKINDILESIKKEINKKFDEEKEKLVDIINKTKEKKESIENSVESVPNSFNNIIQRNDLVQGKIIFEDLKKMNKNIISKEEIEDKKEINTNLFIESYHSKNIQLTFPDNGQYIEEFNIINKNLDFIQGHPCKLQISLLGGNVNISLLINVNKKFYEENEPKFYGHFEITNSLKKLQFSSFQSQIYSDEYQILTNEFNFKEIRDMISLDNKFDFSLFIIKNYYK